MPFALALAAALAALHPNSLSSSTLVVEGARVRHELVVQPTGLIEVLPGIDRDGDGTLDADELEARREDVFEYVARHHLLRAGAEGAAPLERRLERLALAPPPFPAPPGTADWVRIDSSCDAPAPIELLAVESRLFFLTSPDHRDFCSVRWDGVEAFEATFSEFEPTRVFRRSEVEFVSSLGWIARGLREMLFGLEHAAFLAVLLAGARSARGAVRALGTFGLAWLAGYALELAALDPFPPRFVSLSVALSSAFLASQILLRRERASESQRAAPERLLEAAVFGAVHGFDLARAARVATSALEPALGSEVAFGCGGALGQLVALATALLLGRALRGRTLELARRAVALLALAFGLFAFASRAGWIAR